MKWNELLEMVHREAVFSTGVLAAGQESLAQVRLQLNRWVKDGKIIRLKRGLYTLAPLYRKVDTEPFVIANAMMAASYVSLQSALSYYNMIPEHVPAVTSVTTKRPEEIANPLGRFIFRHIRKKMFYGYVTVELSGRDVFVATPEKALLDLVYLTPDADDERWLEQLRLQDTERLNIERLYEYARKSGKPKLYRVARKIESFVKRLEGEKA